jgi:hypothetical protein
MPDGLTALVEELQREIAGLRRRQATRAVIEQAKGILMERHRIGPAAAFAELRRISQRENARLVDVAATVIGAVVPAGEAAEALLLPDDALPEPARLSPGASTAWRALRQWPRIRAAAVGAIVESLASAAEDGDEAAKLLAELAGCDGMTITALRDDGSLEIIGAYGYPASAASAWRRIPLTLDVPLARSAKTGEAIFVGSLEQMETQYPAMRGAMGDFRAAATIPVRDDGQVLGVVLVNWRDDHAFDAAEEERVRRAVERPGTLLVANLGGRDPNPRLLGDLLRLNPDPWLVLGIAPNGSVDAHHLVIEEVSGDLHRPGLRGVRVLSAFPELAAQEDLLHDLLRVLHDDSVLLHTVSTPGPSGAPWDRSPGELRAIRSGGRLVLTWRGRD